MKIGFLIEMDCPGCRTKVEEHPELKFGQRPYPQCFIATSALSVERVFLNASRLGLSLVGSTSPRAMYSGVTAFAVSLRVVHPHLTA